MSFADEIKKTAALKVGKLPLQAEGTDRIKLLMKPEPPTHPAADAPPPSGSGCGGCSGQAPAPGTPPPPQDVTINPTFLMGLKDLTGALADMAAYVTGEKTTEEEFAKRKSACESCPAKDSAGRLLFREFRTTWFSCGALRTQNMLRDSKKEGCGCVLNIKWASKPQTCPLQEPRW